MSVLIEEIRRDFGAGLVAPATRLGGAHAAMRQVHEGLAERRRPGDAEDGRPCVEAALVLSPAAGIEQQHAGVRQVVGNGPLAHQVLRSEEGLADAAGHPPASIRSVDQRQRGQSGGQRFGEAVFPLGKIPDRMG
jgi:hypothetical protein